MFLRFKLLILDFSLLSIICFIFLPIANAETNVVTLKLRSSNLVDSIRLLANMIPLNVMLSPAIKGEAILEINEAAPLAAFDLLLAANGLSKWQYGNIWYVAPDEELLKRKQDELKSRELSDEAAPLMTHVWQIRYGKAEEIAKLLQEGSMSLLSKRGSVRVDARTNMILLSDIASRVNIVNQLIARVDAPVKQIQIEARLVSVDHDVEKELGISFGVQSKTSQAAEGSTPKLSSLEMGRYSMAVATLADGSLLDVKLAALENRGQAELISNPRLFAANQQPALIEAGEEVPYQEVSDSGGTAVTFKKAVLGLKVTPQVLPDNQVLLQLQINQDRPSNRMVQGVPTITTRQMTTQVLVKNGDTIVLGGIYETNNEKAVMRLPFLSDIPVLGVLFQQQVMRQNKRELLIFVTPKVVTQES